MKTLDALTVKRLTSELTIGGYIGHFPITFLTQNSNPEGSEKTGVFELIEKN